MAGVTDRPHLLFLCQTLPYPPDGGVWIRTYHVFRLLARAFDITALCFERPPMPGNRAAMDVEASRKALGRFGRVEVFPIPQRQSVARYAFDHLRSTVTRRVYTTYLYQSKPFQQRLEQLLRSTRFDLVHVDSLDLVRYLPACDGIPVVCVHHDVESDLLKRRAAIEQNRWRRAYLRYQARLTEDVEHRWCPRIALNVAVSDADRALLKQIAPASRVTVVPNGVDIDEFRPAQTDGKGIAFVGGANWFPNLDALEFFCRQIQPELKGRAHIPVKWIGTASSEQQRTYRERYGVELTGYVEDARPLMAEAACHIVPLRAGGGTRLKILNAWAMGKAIVSTSLGCEGLAAIDGQNILVRDDPKEFATAILSVLTDNDLRRRLEREGRATAERLYSWDIVGQDMNDSYLAIANAGSRHRAPAVALGGQPRFGHL